MESQKLAIQVLLFIQKNPRSSPLYIARSLLRRPGLIRNYLGFFSEIELIHTPVRGTYLITQLGELFLEKYFQKSRGE